MSETITSITLPLIRRDLRFELRAIQTYVKYELPPTTPTLARYVLQRRARDLITRFEEMPVEEIDFYLDKMQDQIKALAVSA